MKSQSMWLLGTIFLLAGVLAVASAQASAGRQASAVPCQTGSYRMADGSVLDIGPGAPAQLRWRRTDGRTGALVAVGEYEWSSTLGWTERPDGPRARMGTASRSRIAGATVSAWTMSQAGVSR